jgi:hypothetical protein
MNYKFTERQTAASRWKRARGQNEHHRWPSRTSTITPKVPQISRLKPANEGSKPRRDVLLHQNQRWGPQSAPGLERTKEDLTWGAREKRKQRLQASVGVTDAASTTSFLSILLLLRSGMLPINYVFHPLIKCMILNEQSKEKEIDQSYLDLFDRLLSLLLSWRIAYSTNPSTTPSPHWALSRHPYWPCITCIAVRVRLVSMIARLYLNLAHGISTFSLPLTHQYSSSRLQHPVHNHISLLFSSQHHHSIFKHFKLILTTKLRKQLYTDFKYDT